MFWSRAIPRWTLAALLTLGGLVAFGADREWVGGRTDFTHPQNWDGKGGRFSSSNDAVFKSGVSLVEVDADYQINSIRFAPGALPFSLLSSGGDRVLTLFRTNLPSLINQSGITQSIEVGLSLANGPHTWEASSGTLALSGPVSLDANTLTLYGAGNFHISGAIAGSGGLVKSGAGTTTFLGNNTYTGSTTVQAGVLSARSNTALGATAAGTTVLSGGTLEVHGSGLVIAETLTLAGAGHAGTGALRNVGGNNTVSGSLTLSSTSRVAAAEGSTLTVSGSVGGSGGLTVAGGGDVRLTGDNTFSGHTTVSGGKLVIGAGAGNAINGGTLMVQDGGTLLLDSGSRIAASTSLVLGGGTLQLNGNNLTLASLTLTADSVIDFGGGGAVLDFTAGALGDWGSHTLTLINWEGSLTGGGSDIIRFGATGISQDQASRIRFQDPAGFGSGNFPGNALSDGEIVPTPEPATWAVGILLSMVGLAHAWRRRRRAQAFAAEAALHSDRAV